MHLICRGCSSNAVGSPASSPAFLFLLLRSFIEQKIFRMTSVNLDEALALRVCLHLAPRDCRPSMIRGEDAEAPAEAIGKMARGASAE